MSKESEDRSVKKLFRRVPDTKTVHEWTRSLENFSPLDKAVQTFPYCVFRIGVYWLALAISEIKETTAVKQVHKVPHLSGKIFKGLINLNGSLQLVADLGELLQIKNQEAPLEKPPLLHRSCMLAIERKGERWVILADEIEGIHLLNPLEIESIPTNALLSPYNYFKGIARVKEKTIGILNEELLFSGLRRVLT